MKILHILPSISLKLGGPTQVALNLVQELRNKGVEAEIATCYCDSSELPASGEFADVPVRFFKASRFKLRQFIPSFDFTHWLWENCEKYDLIDIHYFFTFSSTVAATIARIKGVPYTVRPMGQLTEWSLRHKAFRKKLYWQLFDKGMLKHAAAIHCTSQGEVDDVKRLGASEGQCIVHPLGASPCQVDDAASARLKLEYDLSPSSLTILFLSRVHEKKRPELLIDATAQLIREGKEIHLIIAGEGETSYVDSLKNLARNLGVESRIHFAGFLQGEKKTTVLQGSDIFALPSYSENFGIAIAEALHHGLPVVVSSDVQISHELKAANAAVVINESTLSLKDALGDLIGSREKRSLLRKNALEFARRNYSWPKIAGQVSLTYQALLEQKPILETRPD